MGLLCSTDSTGTQVFLRPGPLVHALYALLSCLHPVARPSSSSELLVTIITVRPRTHDSVPCGMHMPPSSARRMTSQAVGTTTAGWMLEPCVLMSSPHRAIELYGLDVHGFRVKGLPPAVFSLFPLQSKRQYYVPHRCLFYSRRLESSFAEFHHPRCVAAAQ